MNEQEITEAKNELVQQWLIKAERDLASTRILGEEVYFDTALYHAQQAAEKAVKGLLLFYGQDFEKTQDIEKLVRLGIPLVAELELYLVEAKLLTPYAVRFRYPDDFSEPSQAEFDEALDAATNYTFILSKLPKEVHP